MIIHTISVQTVGLVVRIISAAATNRRPIEVIIYPR